MIVIEGKRVRLRNYKKLTHVSDTVLRIAFLWTNLTIEGSQFQIIQYDYDEIIVEGIWLKIQFESVNAHD